MAGRVLFFGKLRDIAGAAELALPAAAAGQRLSTLAALLTGDNPGLRQALAQPSVRVALNMEIVARDTDPLLPPGSEVAYMPPMSGG